VTAHRAWLLLGAFWAGCAGNPSLPPGPNVDDGGCQDDPVGRSKPPADCPRDLPADSDCPTAVPGFESDVEPILASRCKLCHAPHQVAERVLFDTYGEAFGWYKLMYTQVFACTMPPSCAGRLPEVERQTLLKWFVCKAPPGPAPPIDSGAIDAADGPIDAGDEISETGGE
jgi:hypothetical protein